ncbi:hypothetical protein [Micromonospora sp. NPDC005367]|uniref:hypothetical protein n=1 Tax=Micromonospora sp. NPDC005367 TaxID=3155590 RepID=UPI0033B108B0
MAVPAPELAEQLLTFRAYADEWLAQLVKPRPETIRDAVAFSAPCTKSVPTPTPRRLSGT